MKKAALFILTIVIIISSINYVSNIIKFKQYSTYSKSMYYKENIDYDVIFFGTSIIHYAISPLYLYKKYGLSSFNLAVPGCQYGDLIAITSEALKSNKSKVFVLEASVLLSNSVSKAFGKGNIASINDFIVKYNTYYKMDNNVLEALKNSSNYFLFHNRWKELNSKDFNSLNYLRGYFSEAVKRKRNFYDDTKEYKLTNEQIKRIDDYINLIQKNNIKLILVVLPTTRNNNDLSDAAINAIETYVKKYNIEFINLKHLNNFDIEKYMIDAVHLNFKGGKNIMDRENFIPYIMKKYNLQDHRNDKKYASWHKDYLKQERMINGEELKHSNDFNAWWNYANYDNYTIISSVNGDNVTNRLPQEIKDKFSSKGLNKFETNQEKMNYAFIINNNQVYFESASQSNVAFKERIENNLNLTLYSAGNAGIMISGKYRGKNKYGLNFVVYDKVNREVVDSIWVAPEDFNKVNR